MIVWIPGQPIPQGRARTGGGHHMDPSSRVWREKAVVYLRRAMAEQRGQVLDVLCAADVLVIVQRPQRRPELVSVEAWATGERTPAGSAGDVDNYAKAALDAAQDVGWITRDHLVAELRVRKVYAAAGQAPGLALELVALAAGGGA